MSGGYIYIDIHRRIKSIDKWLIEIYLVHPFIVGITSMNLGIKSSPGKKTGYDSWDDPASSLFFS